MDDLIKSEIEEIESFSEILEPFGICSESEANETLRKLRAVKIIKKEKEELANKEIERINSWLEKETKSLDATIEYFNNELIAYYKYHKSINPKFKMSLPYGKVSLRKTKKWSYDEEVLTEYLCANEPSLLKIETSINKSELKKLFKDGVNTNTGEIIPGITIEEEESYSVKEVE